MLNTTYQRVSKAFLGPNFAVDDDYIELVKQTRQSLEGLGLNARLAVEAAYIFSRKVPANERQDMFQELMTAILAAGTEDPAFAYTIARRDWQNWWAKYKLHSQFYQGYLSEVITNSDGAEVELAELLVGEVEFEAKMIDKLDARRLWQQIPKDIQGLVLKRLQGKPLGAPRNANGGRPKQTQSLGNTERQRLSRWVKAEGYTILIN